MAPLSRFRSFAKDRRLSLSTPTRSFSYPAFLSSTWSLVSHLSSQNTVSPLSESAAPRLDWSPPGSAILEDAEAALEEYIATLAHEKDDDDDDKDDCIEMPKRPSPPKLSIPAIDKTIANRPLPALPPGELPPMSPSARYENRALPPIPPRPPRPAEGLDDIPRMSWQGSPAPSIAGDSQTARQMRFASVDESRRVRPLFSPTTQLPPLPNEPRTPDIKHPVPQRSNDKILKLTGVSLSQDLASSPTLANPSLHKSSHKIKQLMGADVGPSEDAQKMIFLDEPFEMPVPPLPLKSQRRSLPEQGKRSSSKPSASSWQSADGSVRSKASSQSYPESRSSQADSISILDPSFYSAQTQTIPEDGTDTTSDVPQDPTDDESRSSSPSATSSVYSEDEKKENKKSEGNLIVQLPGPLVGSPAPEVQDADTFQHKNSGPDPLIKEFNSFTRGLDTRYSVAHMERGFGFPEEDDGSSTNASVFSHTSAQVSPLRMKPVSQPGTQRHSGIWTAASSEPASTPELLPSRHGFDLPFGRNSLEEKLTPAPSPRRAFDLPPGRISLDERARPIWEQTPGTSPSPSQKQQQRRQQRYGSSYDAKYNGYYNEENEEDDEVDLYHANAKEAAAAERASREAAVAAAKSAKKSKKGLKGFSTRMLQGSSRKGAPSKLPLNDIPKSECSSALTTPGISDEPVSIFEMDDDDDYDDEVGYFARMLRWPTSTTAVAMGGVGDDDDPKRHSGASSNSTGPPGSPRDGVAPGAGSLSGFMSSALRLQPKKDRRRDDIRNKIRVIPEGSPL